LACRPAALPRPAARPTSARPGLRHAPAWRWQRHFWSFRPHWGLDSGGTTLGSGLAKLGVSVPVLERAARSARILTWAGCPERDRASRACPGPEDPPRNPGFAAGSVTGRVLAAGCLRRADRVRATPARGGGGGPRVAWRSGMSHGPARAAGSMDVVDGDFLGADRCGSSNRARPRSADHPNRQMSRMATLVRGESDQPACGPPRPGAGSVISGVSDPIGASTVAARRPPPGSSKSERACPCSDVPLRVLGS